MKSILLAAAFLVAAASMTACGRQDKKDVVARVADVSISRDEFRDKVEALPKQLRAVALANKREFVEDIAAEHLLVKEAERRKLDELTDVKRLFDAARRKILIAKLVELEIDKKITVTPEEVSAYYEAHKDEFMTPQLFRASHILVRTEEEANQIKAELDAGADFEELARKRSTDQTALRGGDLGFFQKGQFVQEFEEAVLSMKKGETSPVVKSRFGYHIIRLTDRVEPTRREFAAVKGFVEERLRKEKRTEALKSFLSGLRGDAKVEMDEAAMDAAAASAGEAQP
jgi:peptidyl-prolyl cis-trans isomerase C